MYCSLVDDDSYDSYQLLSWLTRELIKLLYK